MTTLSRTSFQSLSSASFKLHPHPVLCTLISDVNRKLSNPKLDSEPGIPDPKPGEMIYTAGSAPTAMYIVISGSINLLTQDPVTKEKHIEVLNSGSVFGEEALFLSQVHRSSAKTEGFCELYELSVDDFEVVMATHPESHRR